MGCNCKANAQIVELGKRYGTTVKRTRKDIVKSGLWKAVQNMFLLVFAIAVTPFIFLYIFYKAGLRKESINLHKIFGLKKKEYV